MGTRDMPSRNSTSQRALLTGLASVLALLRVRVMKDKKETIKQSSFCPYLTVLNPGEPVPPC